MGKRNITLYLDSNLIELAKNKGLNISKELSSFLKQKLEFNISDNKDLEKTKLEIDNKISELEILLKDLKEKKERIEKKKKSTFEYQGKTYNILSDDDVA